jgi:hypothetical protein
VIEASHNCDTAIARPIVVCRIIVRVISGRQMRRVPWPLHAVAA